MTGTARLAVSHYICPDGYPVQRFLDAAVSVGAGAVGLTVRAIDEVGVVALKAMLDERGLAVSSLNSAGYFTFADSGRAAEQDRLNRRLLEAAAALEAGVLCVITGGKEAAQAALETARAGIAEQLAEFAELARTHDVRLGLEPIHPAEIMAKGCVNSIADAVALTAPLPGVDMIVDLYHSWWDPQLQSAFEDHLPRIALVQFCNLRAQGPGQPLDRDTPSSGELDVAGLLRSVAERGYAGWYEFELFAAQLRGRTVDAVLGEVADFHATWRDHELPRKEAAT
jgi:sugar phosphate isomerase/epimerase